MTISDLWGALAWGTAAALVTAVCTWVGRPVFRPHGQHRAVPTSAADPGLVRLAELIETGEVEAEGLDYCPMCGTRTLHLFHINNTATCQVCQTTTTDGD